MSAIPRLDTVQTRSGRVSLAPILFPLGGIIAIALVSVSESRAAPVLLPIAFVLTALGSFLVSLGRDTSGAPPYFEIGWLYAAAVGLYAIYPLVGFVANGLRYTPLNDLRLFLANPSPEDMGRLGWMYAVHLVSFMGVYRLLRRKPRSEGRKRIGIGRTEVILLLLSFAAIQAFFYFLGRAYNWSFSTNLDRYLAFANLPRLIAQVSGHLDGIRFTVELAFLAFLFQRYQKARVWIGLCLAAIAVKTVLERQSRTELVLLALASVMMYHRWVQPVRARVLAVMALVGLAGFNLLGSLRSSDPNLAEAWGVQRLFVANEFETLMANAYDVDQRARSNALGPIPPGFLALDLIALVPQQLLAFSKTSPADWYIRTFFPEAAELGIGLCFGTVSEAIVAGGWPALVLRGALLGLILALVQRTASRREHSFWWMVLLIWASVSVYHSVRNTTFSLLALFWYHFLPVVFVVSGGAWLLRLVFGKRPASR